MVLTEPAVTHEKICEFSDKWVVCIRYNPTTKSGFARCLRKDCVNPLPTEPVRCEGCMLPRFCSSGCAATDFEHSGICIPKRDPAAPPSAPSEHVQLHMVNTDAFKLVARYNDALFVNLSAFGMHMRLTKMVMDVFYKCGECQKSVPAISHMCFVCKREFYCDAVCKEKRVDKHECKPHRCLMDKKASVIACFNKPLPHDEGGKLMLMGIKSTFMQMDISKGFSKTDPNEIKRKMLEIYAIRDIEAEGWKSLGDYIGAAMARWSAAMIAAEYDDCCVGLEIMKKAKSTLQMAPKMFVLKHIDRVVALKKMINASIHCLTSIIRTQMMRAVLAHIGDSIPDAPGAQPDAPGAQPDGYATAPESGGSDAAAAAGPSRRSKARRSSPQ